MLRNPRDVNPDELKGWSSNLYENEMLKKFMGDAFRPGGEQLTQVLGEKLVKDISELSSSHGRFLGDLIGKARVKQASRAYALGLSLSSAIELTGANRFELYAYIGRTKIHDDMPSKSVAQRYETTKKVLGGGS